MFERLFASLWKNTVLRLIVLNAAVFALYFPAGKLGLSFAFFNPSASVIWPPTGIALASLLFFGRGVAPAIFLGALAVNYTTTGHIPSSLVIALGNMGEGLLGMYLVNRFSEGIHAFENAFTIFSYAFFAGIISTLLSATFGVMALYFFGFASAGTAWSVWLTWWLGDMGGSLVVAPLLLVWGNSPWIRFKLLPFINFITSFSLLLLVTLVVFTGILPYSYLCIPFGVWIAFWFGQKGSTLATFLVGVVAMFYTLTGSGPFAAEPTLNHSLTILELFVATFSITTLVLGILTHSLRKSEGEMAARERRFLSLIEKSYDGVVLIDASSKIQYASPAIERITGYTVDELVGTPGLNLVVPEDRERAESVLTQLALRPGGVANIEYRSQRKDEKIIWVEATGTNLLLEPNVEAIVVNFRDITDRKQAEAEILREKQTDEAMLSSIGEGMIATDSQGRITLVNEAGAALLGWEPPDLIGRAITEAVPMNDETGKLILPFERPNAKVLSLGKALGSASSGFYARKDGTTFPVRFTITPILLEERVVGTIEVFSDVTQEREVDKAKSEFVSLASHQLRTPLTTLRWYLESLLQDEGLPLAERQKFVAEAYQATQRMRDLVNALLDVSRLELGKLPIELRKVNLAAIANQILPELRAELEKRKIALKTEYDPPAPTLFADSRLMTIIMQNLLSNAAKYTRDGGEVELEISIDKKEATIMVKDNGMGIPKDVQEKIYTKMFRAENAQKQDPGGTGLGLYMVKAIVDRTNGKIRFESEEGKGTTFWVTYPAAGMTKLAPKL